MGLPEMADAARRKGLGLVGTGDCTHPEWLAEARRCLRPRGPGIYGLDDVHFLLSGEISLVWREGGHVRRVHLVLLAPSFEAAARIAGALQHWGSLTADGRPTLKCSARDAADAVWSAAADAVLIPAHVWTPWFSILGSRSGFDSVEECFGLYAERVGAVESGLSSDPAMCRRTATLRGRAIVSFSDAHSPDRLGREATVLRVEEMSYAAVTAALLDPTAATRRTIELFPEEGKYYHDGHRRCGVSFSPEAARVVGGICPRCGKPLTVGVLHRVDDVEQSADAGEIPPFDSVIPLAEILSHILGRGPESKAVAAAAGELVRRFGPELRVLLEVPVEALRDGGTPAIGEAIDAVRKGRVSRSAGYDGVFGRIVPIVPEAGRR